MTPITAADAQRDDAHQPLLLEVTEDGTYALSNYNLPDTAQRVLAELADNDEYGWAEAIGLIKSLLRFREEALEVLSGWDKVYAALNPDDAPLGESRSSIALRAVGRLRAELDRRTNPDLAARLTDLYKNGPTSGWRDDIRAAARLIDGEAPT